MQFLKGQLPVSEGGGGGTGPGQDIGWNFYSKCRSPLLTWPVFLALHVSLHLHTLLLHAEYLVDKNGMPVKRFTQEYHVDEVEAAIYRLLFSKQ
jgi:hypothetical protein